MSEARSVRPSIIEIELFSGVIVHITPVSPMTYGAILAKGLELFPIPKPPEVEQDNAAFPLPDENNPEYLEAKSTAQDARNKYVTDVLREMSLAFPQGKDTITALFAERLRTLRKTAVLDSQLDDWRLIFEHFVVSDQDEWRVLNDAMIKGNLPLTQEEVDGASRIFRVDVSRARRAKLDQIVTSGVDGSSSRRGKRTG